MSVALTGFGWVTPLGTDLEGVWARLGRGERAEAKELANPETGRVHRYAPVPPKLVEHLARQPRLRRASAISYYSVAAGLAALEHAGVTMTPELAARTAVIFAVSSGSVIYTRRFYEGLVKQGAASPLLFPETVYNAPASHLAAQLGIDGYSYTVVGDSSVGLGAVALAQQLLAADEVDRCLVVGAEEVDWVLCEAYADWRFGALLAEGAGALLLTRDEAASWTLSPVVERPFFSRREASAAAQAVVDEFPVPDLAVGSANGSWIDAIEAPVLASMPRCIYPRKALGEALGAGAIWQVIAAALALQKGTALVLSVGLNQQASGLLVHRAL